MDAITGSAACLKNGGAIANGIGTESMANGFPFACYTPAIAVDPWWPILSAWNSCSMQFFYSTLLWWSYLDEPGWMTTAFDLLLPPSITATWHVGSGLIPDMMTLKTPTCSVIIINGTQNFQQWACQAFYGIQPPQNFGIYSTLPLWYHASNVANSYATMDGLDPLKPIMIVGHSYGGAAASNLAARYKTANPARDVQTMTFGSPRVGDNRLRAFLDTLPGISLANDADIVTALPPDLLTLFPVSVALGLSSLLVWADWIQESNRALMASDGSLTFNVSPTLGTTLLLSLTNLILLGQPFPDFVAHWIEQYRQRILIRCPVEEWPVNHPTWLWLNKIGFPDYFGPDFFGKDYFGKDFWM